jgi:branched-chain amino acid transport system permease protein
VSAKDTYRGPLVLAAVIAVVTLLGAGSSVNVDTSFTIASTALLSISFALAYGQAGILSVAQASFASFGAYATAIVTTRLGWPLPAGLAASIVLPAVVAYAVARPIVRLSPFAMAMATLTLGQLYTVALARGGDLTGGYVGLTGIPPLPFVDSPLTLHLVAWSAVLLACVLLAHVRFSLFGRSLRIIARDPVLARSLGISIGARLSGVFALSAAIAGAGGWLYAHTRLFLAADSLPVMLSLTLFIMVLIGGRRSVLGPVLGTTLLILVADHLPGDEYQGMIYGAVLVAAVLLLPEGLLAERRRGRREVTR